MCAVLLKTEPTSSANYVREFSFALLGLLSYIYAGFFLLYPKLMPLKEIKTEKVPEKEVSKVEEGKNSFNIFILWFDIENSPSPPQKVPITIII